MATPKKKFPLADDMVWLVLFPLISTAFMCVLANDSLMNWISALISHLKR